MRRLSLWASMHKWQARLLLVIIHFLLIAIALFIGDILFSLAYTVPSGIIYFLLLLYFVGCCLYPSRKSKKQYTNFYKRQKFCDGLVVTASFLLILSAANHRYVSNSPFHSGAAASVRAIQYPNIEKPFQPSGKKVSFFKKLKMKLAAMILKIRTHYQKASTGEKALLIFLAILAASLLICGVLALSCNLACSGSDALAVVVGVLGTALVIFLLVKLIKSINRKYKKPA